METYINQSDTNSPYSDKKTSYLLISFIIAYALIYIILPSIFYETILPDSAQNISWGHYLGLSYNRHPPLGTWLITLTKYLFGNNEAATFSASMLCLSVSLMFIFKLSNKYLDKNSAMLATVLSSLSLYFMLNFALQYNQNTIMLPFWVMIVYFTDKSIHSNNTSDWLFLGLVSAGAMLAKYESILIIFLAVIYLALNFKKKYIIKLLLSFLVFLLLLLPHILSVFKNGFLTFQFIDNTVIDSPKNNVSIPHLYFPLKAFYEQVLHLILPIILLFSLSKIGMLSTKNRQSEAKALDFLIYIGLSPLLLIVLISFILGIKIQAEWGFPIFAFTVPAIIKYFNIKIRKHNLIKITILTLIIHVISLSGYKYIQYNNNKASRTNYPSHSLAKTAENYWHKYTSKPIKYVGGDEFIYYYLAAYLQSDPLLLEHYSYKESPWLSKADIERDGLMVIMNGCKKEKTDKMIQQFSIKHSACKDIPLTNKKHYQTMQVTLLLLPPQ